MSIGRSLRTYRQLTPAARRAALAALPTYCRVAIGLRLRGLNRLARRIADLPGVGPPKGDAEVIGEVVTRLGNHLPWKPRCLERSLVLQHLLRRRGHDARLVIGVRKRAAGDLPTTDSNHEADVSTPIEAHAWVEVADQVVGDRADVARGYEIFEDLEAAFFEAR